MCGQQSVVGAGLLILEIIITVIRNVASSPSSQEVWVRFPALPWDLRAGDSVIVSFLHVLSCVFFGGGPALC